MTPLIDAHNHLHDDWLAPYRESVFEDLESAGIQICVVNGTNEADWPEVRTLCSARPALQTAATHHQPLVLLPSFGLHPWDVGNRTPDWQQHLQSQIDRNPNASIGEIGLDHWILDRARPDDSRLAGLRRAPMEEQIEVFRWQLALATDRNLPVSIHCLDAFGALHEVLRSTPLPPRGFLLHAYSGSYELAESFAKLGAYFSFNGAFLESRKERLREMYTRIRTDRLLIETDAPAMRLPADRETFRLPPGPEGNPFNHPANLVVTYAALAQLRGISVDSLRDQVAENFDRLFIRTNVS